MSKYVWSLEDLAFDEPAPAIRQPKRPASVDAMMKGDYVGHPFRGNQWTGGRGGLKTADKVAWAAVPFKPSDAKHSFILQAQAEDKKMKYLVDPDGSFLDYVDENDPTPVVKQMADSFEEYTGIKVQTQMDWKKIDKHAAAEILDCLYVLKRDWPDVKVGQLVLGSSTLSGAFGAAFPTDKAWTAKTLSPYGEPQLTKAQTLADFAPTIFINKDMLTAIGAEHARLKIQTAIEMGKFVTSNIPPHQYIVLHEFGHVLEYNLVYRAPASLWKIQAAAIGALTETIGPAGATMTKKTGAEWLKDRQKTHEYQLEIAQENADIAAGKKTGSTSFSLTNKYTTLFGGGDPPTSTSYMLRPILKKILGEYGGGEKAKEVWAELFSLAYANPSAKLPPEAAKLAKATLKAIENEWPTIEAALSSDALAGS